MTVASKAMTKDMIEIVIMTTILCLEGFQCCRMSTFSCGLVFSTSFLGWSVMLTIFANHSSKENVLKRILKSLATEMRSN